MTYKTSNRVRGVVVDCIKLNIRKRPDIYSTSIKVVDCLTELTILSEEPGSTWYKVKLDKGVTGFCPKEFVALKEERSGA